MLKRLKRAVKEINKKQNGQILILVLIVLALGGIVLTPTLNYTATSLKHQQVIETDTLELYAADAGVEDAIWQIKNEQITTPNQLIVNDKQVVVEIVLEEDVEGFLYELLQNHYSGVHSDWTVVEEEVGAGTYTITVTYSGNANKKFLTGVGAWLQGDYEYVINSASGMTDDYPNYSFEEKDYKGGTAFIWAWTGGNKPEFGKQSGVFTRSLTFHFTPEEVPDFHFSWFVGGSSDVGIITSAKTFEIWKVTSTATSDDGTSTTIESYVSIISKAFPLFQYAIATTNGDITIDESSTITSSPTGGEGNIRANGDITLKGGLLLLSSVEVDGDVTATGNIYKEGIVEITGEETTGAAPMWVPSEEEIDALAAKYEAEAKKGGTHNGDYTIGLSDPKSLGPLYIDGDLTLSGAGEVTLEGTVYVNGCINMLGLSCFVGSGSIVARDDITLTGIAYPLSTPPENSAEDIPVIVSINGSISAPGLLDSWILGVLYAPRGSITMPVQSLYGSAVGQSFSSSSLLPLGTSRVTYPLGLKARPDLPGSGELELKILTYTIQ